MKILSYILFLIVGIIALILLIALFVKKEFRLEKQVIIQKPKQEVFDYLKMIRNQEDYSVWVMRDLKIKIVYTGTDGTVGFICSWSSDDKYVGVGAQAIMEL